MLWGEKRVGLQSLDDPKWRDYVILGADVIREVPASPEHPSDSQEAEDQALLDKVC